MIFKIEQLCGDKFVAEVEETLAIDISTAYTYIGDAVEISDKFRQYEENLADIISRHTPDYIETKRAQQINAARQAVVDAEIKANPDKYPDLQA